MAEGMLTTLRKYYCHYCTREVSPFYMADLSCPDCSSGCIEEVSKDLFNTDTYSCPDDEYESDLDDVSNFSFIPDTMDNIFSQVLMDVAEELPEENVPRRRRVRTDPSRSRLREVMRQIGIQEVLNDDEEAEDEPLEEPFDEPFVSFRYFDDFSGDEEIDALASQLLDEIDISGPPPLCKEEIKILPFLQITQGHLEKGMQCTVCMDDFSLREKVKQLPCNHLYHEKCITPWLERQGSCPNCREVVQVQLKNKRSRSCPRTRFNPRNDDSRRFSEASTLSDFFTTSLNPFRF